MKKIYIILLIAIIAIGIVSCEKEDSKSQISGYSSLNYKLDRIPIMKLKSQSKSVVTDIHQLMTNPDDADDEKINNYLYQISLATRELIKDPQFNEIIINMAQQSETNAANLLDLANVAPEYYNIINDNLDDHGLSLQGIAEDLTHRPVAPNPDYPVTAEIEHYVPAIFVPNLEIANPGLQPIISPNVVVDSREDTTYEDNVIAWFYDHPEDEDVVEIMLSEETAINTNNPVFLLDNAVTSFDTEINLEFVPLNNEREEAQGTVTQGEKSFSSYEHSIESQSYRYESGWSGRSEFTVTAARLDPNGTEHLIYRKSGGTYKSWQQISKIKKNEIGTIRSKWKYHASDWQPWSNPWTPNIIQNSVNIVFWNTFERDWNRSLKDLGVAYACGSDVNLTGNMKYNSNWYAWIPSTVQVHYTRFEWIDKEWAHWNNSWKSKFRIWKVYI